MGFTFGIGLELKIKQRFVLEEIRKKKGLSRKELAEKSGVGEMTIVCLELGKNDPSKAKIDTLIKLAKALKCKVRDFYPQEKSI